MAGSPDGPANSQERGSLVELCAWETGNYRDGRLPTHRGRREAGDEPATGRGTDSKLRGSARTLLQPGSSGPAHPPLLRTRGALQAGSLERSVFRWEIRPVALGRIHQQAHGPVEFSHFIPGG